MTSTLTCASGARPPIRSAAFSAIMMIGALILPPDKVRHHRGVDDAQTLGAEDTELVIHHRQVIGGRADFACAEQMMNRECG